MKLLNQTKDKPKREGDLIKVVILLHMVSFFANLPLTSIQSKTCKINYNKKQNKTKQTNRRKQKNENCTMQGGVEWGWCCQQNQRNLPTLHVVEMVGKIGGDASWRYKTGVYVCIGVCMPLCAYICMYV